MTQLFDESQPAERFHRYRETHSMMERECPESDWLDFLKTWERHVTVILWISAGLFLWSLWALIW